MRVWCEKLIAAYGESYSHCKFDEIEVSTLDAVRETQKEALDVIQGETMDYSSSLQFLSDPGLRESLLGK